MKQRKNSRRPGKTYRELKNYINNTKLYHSPQRLLREPFAVAHKAGGSVPGRTALCPLQTFEHNKKPGAGPGCEVVFTGVAVAHIVALLQNKWCGSADNHIYFVLSVHSVKSRHPEWGVHDNRPNLKVCYPKE